MGCPNLSITTSQTILTGCTCKDKSRGTIFACERRTQASDCPTMAAQKISFAFCVVAFLGAASSIQALSVQFGYSGSNGPANWGKLSSSFSLCSNGKQQSPIEISKNSTSYDKKLQAITMAYAKSANATLVNNGFNVGVIFEGNAGEVVMDGKNYSLKQLQWRSPAEHVLNGVRHPAELQLLHQAKDGSLAAVALLYGINDDSELINKIGDKFNELAEEKCGSDEEAQIALKELEIKDLMKQNDKYYRYVGSLTAPPCTENVNWVVIAKVRSISKEQIEFLKAPLDEAYKKNSRPTQPLNGRKAEKFDARR